MGIKFLSICRIIWISFLLLVSIRCGETKSPDPWSRPIDLPAGHSGDHFSAVIENPVGECYHFYYNPRNGTLDTLIENGEPVSLSFLPHPVNTGFIPGSSSDSDEFERIDVFVLARRMEPGLSYQVTPLALMSFYEFGISKEIILAVPVDDRHKLISATSFQHLLFEQDPLKFAIQHWITYRKGLGSVHTFRWSDELVATSFLKKNLDLR